MEQKKNRKPIFQMDNPFYSVMTTIFNLMEINLLWLLCCLPVITIGASTTALYYSAMKIVRDEGSSVSKGFFKSFRENFRESLPFTLLSLLITAVLVFDFHYLKNINTAGASIAYGILLFAGIIAIAVFSYAYPLLAHFDNTVKGTFNNAWRVAATNLPVTLLITAVNAAPFLWFLLAPSSFSKVFWIWMFIGKGASAFVNSIFLTRIFDSISGSDE
ncbi:MAG: YesL family protein [Eubacterium sp.]|nr:YesL family protein [Eubacterium sp.]